MSRSIQDKTTITKMRWKDVAPEISKTLG